jgi:DNA helicase-2/ATP-dependent DNA helicase PcrA
MEQWMKELNPAQWEAVCHTEGPLLILAGAGSGKTRVLTYRIAKLLLDGVNPKNILAVTFTNKAAEEMRQRATELIGPQAAGIWLATFHSTCVRFLRQDGPAIGLDRNFVIYDTQDQLTVVKEVMRELNLSETNFQPRAVLSTISAAKNELIGPEQYEKQAADFWSEVVRKVYPLYQKKLRQNSAVDFDDLIMLAIELLREHPEILAKYQERFRYIMIDEYQDTNHAQYTLVNLLANKYRNLCVVGDDDQSIYSFRSADIRNILHFEKDYPEVKVVKLEQNYRSTQNILKAANEVIRNNHSRKPKTLWTENEEGTPVTVLKVADEKEEAWLVSALIEQLISEEGRKFSDFALLYRTNAQSRVFEEVFIQKGIPYKIVGGLRFYDRKEIRDILSYLKLIFNPNDRISLRRVINTPKRGIGDVTIERLIDFLDANGLSNLEGLSRVEEAPDLTPRSIRPLTSFYQFLNEMVTLKEQLSISELTERVMEDSGYLGSLRSDDSVESRTRLENLGEFLSITAEFEKESEDKSLSAFLETVALVADVDNYNETQDGATLMTIHSAKGLEFPVVFLVGMEDGIFPHSRSLMDLGELEEERRLCYVGMTRACQRLYLTHALMRTIYGKTQFSIPSRFLDEIPDELLAKPGEREFSSAQKSSSLTSDGEHKANQAKKATYGPGDKISHRKWGIGTIISIEGEGEDAIAKVAFNGLGIKDLLLALAPVDKME